jgi:hypothetical protein
MSNAARALLQDDEDLHNVHSVQSVTSMMRAAREKAAKFDKISNESGPLGHAVKSNVPNEVFNLIIFVIFLLTKSKKSRSRLLLFTIQMREQD